MSSSRSVALTSQPRVTLSVAASAVSTEPLSVDPGSLPGLRVVAAQSWSLAGGGRLDAFCLKVPAPWWLPGLEHSALAGAAALTRRALGAEVLTPGASQRAGRAWQQSFEAGGGSLASSAHGTVHMAFVGQRPDLLLCSVACRGTDWCEPALIWPELAPVPAPPALLGEAAAHPLPALASSALLVALAVLAVLRRRPRPRW